MFEMINNHENDVLTLNQIVTQGQSETVMFQYESDTNIGYYTVSFDLPNERFIIHWYTKDKSIGSLYNEYKYYKFTYQQVKDFLNGVIDNNINTWL